MGEGGGLPAQMLRLLGEGGIHTTAELARRLGVTDELVRLMAEDLARRGYLAVLEAACGAGCAGCTLADACSQDRPDTPAPALIALTAKGRRAGAV